MFLIKMILMFLMLVMMMLFVSFPIIVISRHLNDEFKKKRYWFYLPLASLVGTYFPFVLIFIFFNVYYRKLHKSKRISLFMSLYIYLTYQCLSYFAASFIQDLLETYRDSVYVLVFYCFFILILGIVIVYVNKLLLSGLKLNLLILEKDIFKPLFKKVNWVLSGLVFIQLCLTYFQQVYSWLLSHNSFSNPYTSTISLSILVVYMACLLYVKIQQDHYLHQEMILEKEEEIRNLNQYLDKLGSLYDEIRGFRHDFAGIVTSLEPAIATGDMRSVQRIYDMALVKANRSLNREEYRFFDLKNIQDIAIRSVIANHILKAERENVSMHLEVRDEIPMVQVPMLEVIRMVNIIMDNALEAARETVQPQLSVSVIRGVNEVVLQVKNNRLPQFIDQRKIWERGYSSKGANRGLGLSNLLEVVYQFPNVTLHTEVGETMFTQTLIFQVD